MDQNHVGWLLNQRSILELNLNKQVFPLPVSGYFRFSSLRNDLNDKAQRSFEAWETAHSLTAYSFSNTYANTSSHSWSRNLPYETFYSWVYSNWHFKNVSEWYCWVRWNTHPGTSFLHKTAVPHLACRGSNIVLLPRINKKVKIQVRLLIYSLFFHLIKDLPLRKKKKSSK